jgi:hypothetical protein
MPSNENSDHARRRKVASVVKLSLIIPQHVLLLTTFVKERLLLLSTTTTTTTTTGGLVPSMPLGAGLAYFLLFVREVPACLKILRVWESP